MKIFFFLLISFFTLIASDHLLPRLWVGKDQEIKMLQADLDANLDATTLLLGNSIARRFRPSGPAAPDEMQNSSVVNLGIGGSTSVDWLQAYREAGLRHKKIKTVILLSNQFDEFGSLEFSSYAARISSYPLLWKSSQSLGQSKNTFLDLVLQKLFLLYWLKGEAMMFFLENFVPYGAEFSQTWSATQAPLLSAGDPNISREEWDQRAVKVYLEIAKIAKEQNQELHLVLAPLHSLFLGPEGERTKVFPRICKLTKINCLDLASGHFSDPDYEPDQSHLVPEKQKQLWKILVEEYHL